MRTKRRLCYSRAAVDSCLEEQRVKKKKRDVVSVVSAVSAVSSVGRKRQRPEVVGESDFFDSLPDDLVISILCKLSSSADSPSDFVNVMITYAGSPENIESVFDFFGLKSIFRDLNLTDLVEFVGFMCIQMQEIKRISL